MGLPQRGYTLERFAASTTSTFQKMENGINQILDRVFEYSTEYDMDTFLTICDLGKSLAQPLAAFPDQMLVRLHRNKAHLNRVYKKLEIFETQVDDYEGYIDDYEIFVEELRVWNEKLSREFDAGMKVVIDRLDEIGERDLNKIFSLIESAESRKQEEENDLYYTGDYEIDGDVRDLKPTFYANRSIEYYFLAFCTYLWAESVYKITV
ncbi:16433_t:CDS:2 [Acaulospora morrowiae]|uniref:16433_t:CDS:1 n=1 Tax=Acaulospora morrowiae TaxID=94023 RepID=A0A9N8VU41_9GLOM|nr:16433_t:CDS:2 [Acaulospora morrowiae]